MGRYLAIYFLLLLLLTFILVKHFFFSSTEVRTSDGTASSNQPGNDYNFLSTTVQFAVDASVAYVDINIVKDGLFEEDEQFTVELSSNGPNEEITDPSTATVIIKSDDCKL